MTHKLFFALIGIFIFYCDKAKAYDLCYSQYDEISQMCIVNHPNYAYEQNWRMTPTALALARICISEGGYRLDSGGPIEECIAIYNVFITRNRNISSSDLNLEAMKAYSPRSFDYSRTDSSRRYIPYLNEHGTMPLYWPHSDAAWEERRDIWLKILNLADRLIGGLETFPSPCSGRVHHWAANRQDMIDRALKNNLRRIYCRNVKNAFWQI